MRESRIAAKTVSYTHLDVYKRQDQYTVDYTIKINQAGADLSAICPDGLVITDTTVSYTHLLGQFCGTVRLPELSR